MSTLNNRPRDDGTRDIEHTVYEPNSFTPLVRLTTTAQNPQAKPHLLVQMTKAGTPADKRGSSGNLRSLEMMQSMMAAMPEHMQKEMEKGMKHMLEKGPTPLGRTIMSNMGIDPDKMWGGIREGIKQIEQEKQTPVEIHFYHCDHLGTPIALTDRNGKIVWAAKYDPWGNIEEEFNPHNIEQNIRLPGQHHDRETGLYYNRHRYYDPKIGAYINQDPIGLLGRDANFYRYVANNPIGFTDPYGLEIQVCNRKVKGFPFVGNHAYAWDATTETAEGMRGSSGSGASSEGEKGPKRTGRADGDRCYPVEGSVGKEKDIMDFMRKNQNNGMWFPVLNDCHNAVKDAVEDAELKYPGAPGGRIGRIPSDPSSEIGEIKPSPGALPDSGEKQTQCKAQCHGVK